MIRTNRRRRLRTVAALLTLMTMLFATACSSSDDSSSTDDSSPTSSGGEVSDANPNGVVKVGYDLVQAGGGAFSLDPTRSTTNNNDGLQYLIWGRLLRPLADGSLEPDLAESATIVDPNTITVKLRAGVTFQDGTPFDAAAVKAGLERSDASENGGLGTTFLSLGSVDATAADTVTLKFPAGNAASWYDLLGTWETTIVKPDTNFDGIPVGAGPMKVTAYSPGASISMVKYDGFWAADQVTIGGVDLVQVAASQPQTATAALKAGQVDVVMSDPTQVSSLTGNYQLKRTETEAAVRIDFCKTPGSGPLADPKVRKAVNNAIDRDAVNEGAYDGTAAPAVQMFPEDNRFWNEAVGDDLGYDPAAAKALLTEAGYPNGFPMDLWVPDGLGLPIAGQILEQQLAAVGITMTLHVTNNFVEEFTAANVPGAALAPGSSLGRAKLNSYTGENLANVCDYNDPELTALIAQLQTVNDNSDGAKALWDKTTDIVYGDALGGWLVFRTKLAGYNTTTVGDLTMWPLGIGQVPLVYGTYIKK